MKLEHITQQLEETGVETLDTRILDSEYVELLLLSTVDRVYLKVKTLSDGITPFGFEVLKDTYNPIIGRQYIFPISGTSYNELNYDGMLTYMAVKVGNIKTSFTVEEWPIVLKHLKMMCA